MSLTSTSAQFFYLTVIRQDFISKFFYIVPEDVVSLPRLELVTHPGIEGEEGVVVLRVIRESTIAHWWTVVEGLSGSATGRVAGSIKVGLRGLEKRGVITGFKDSGVCRWWSLNWLHRFFFFWYRGLFTTSVFDIGAKEEITFIDYFPLKKYLTKNTASIWWEQFDKCPVLPDDVWYEPTKLQTTFTFNRGSIDQNKLFLSICRYSQRAAPKTYRYQTAYQFS